MIYTVTFNPSLDYVVQMPELKVGDINRTQEEVMYPGGKGINVSLVLHNLGLDSQTLGFTAGFTGSEIIRLCREHGCSCDFIPIEKGFSRINMKIRAQEETAINGNGPAITPNHLEELLTQLNKLQSGDILVLAGSIPSSLPADTYEKILAQLQGRGIKFVVDATGDLLANVLKYQPWLVKPNNYELAEVLKITINTEEELVAAAKELQKRGAQNVLVSRAENGALLVDAHGQVHKRHALKGELVNSVGAGDSMVAGFIAGYLKHEDYEEALLWGLSSGSASAFKEWLAELPDIEALIGRYNHENN